MTASLLAAAACGGRVRVAAAPPLFPISTLWVTPLPEGIEAPMAGDGARLFVATRDGMLSALDATTGALTWRRQERPGALALGAGLLVVRGATGSVWTLDPASGRDLWNVDSGVPGSLPALVHERKLVVAGQGLAALDLHDGHTLWSATDQPKVTALPVPWGPWLFTGEENAIRRRDAVTGSPLWTFPTRGALLAAVVVDDKQRVLVGTTDRRFVALKADDGSLRWRWKVGADIQAAAVVFEDKVLVASHEDVLYALKRSNGNMVWRAPLPSRPFGPPLLVGSAVLVACHESELIGFDARSGRRLGAFRTPGEMRTPPLLAEDRVYLGLRDRSVIALRLTLQTSEASFLDRTRQALQDLRFHGSSRQARQWLSSASTPRADLDNPK